MTAALAQHDPDPASAGVAALAARLAGHPIERAAQIRGNGNSRVYCVEGDGRRYLLKSYPSPGIDGRNRLAQEEAALGFLNGTGLGSFVPRSIAADRAANAALHSWLDGTAIDRHSLSDIDQAVDFAARLHELSTTEAAFNLPAATESTLSAQELMRQIDVRLGRLHPAAAEDAGLASFLNTAFEPRLDTARRRLVARYDARDLSLSQDLALNRRVLSPSDFGFHNCLRRGDGRLAFFDFEYFGWDDPVRLVIDFLCHPAMALNDDDRRRFFAGTASFLDADPGFRIRFDAVAPLVALKWCLILLNEFLPEHWQRRLRAGAHPDWREAKERQLAKAVSMLDLHMTLPMFGRI